MREKERGRGRMSFLSAVSLRFSVCSPHSLLLTSGRQQESDAGDRKRREAETRLSCRNGTGPQNAIAPLRSAPPPTVCLTACLPMSISPLQATTQRTHPPPSPLTVTTATSLFFSSPSSAISQRRTGRLSANHQITPRLHRNKHMHAHIIQTNKATVVVLFSQILEKENSIIFFG